MKRLLLAAVVLALGSACGSSGSGTAKGSTAPPSASTSPVAVTSSITSGQRLTAAIPWTATPTTTAADPVQDVRFLVDGKVLWTERNSPYVFDDDGQVLAPWLLGNGPHELAVRLTTLGGKQATATASITVAVDTSADAALAGTYQRQVTTADGARTAPYRTPDKGAFGEATPPGLWVIRVLPTGMVVGDEAKDQMKQPFVEPFTVTGARLTLYGPAVWKQADPTQPNVFCEPEGSSSYRWSLSGTRLVITAVDKVCADRDTVFVGTWTRTGA